MATTGGTPRWRTSRCHRRLVLQHPQVMFLPSSSAGSADSALQLSMAPARAKIRGLRILIDASCLGPTETGTQVQTLALIDALVRRDDVAASASPSAARYRPTPSRRCHHRKVRVLAQG